MMADLPYNDRQRLAETEMTVGDLKHLIEQVVQQTTGTTRPEPSSQRPVRDVLSSMRRNLWTPPPGAASNLDLLREDRDQ